MVDLVSSMDRADHQVVPASRGKGALVVTDWQTYASTLDNTNGSVTSLTGWRVDWEQAQAGVYVLQTPIAWRMRDAAPSAPVHSARVRVDLSVQEQR